MSTRIGIISDVHACAAPVREALDIFHDADVAEVLCIGDIAGYGNELAETVRLLIDEECTAILGNHDAWYMEKPPGEKGDPAAAYFSRLPCMWEAVVEGVHLYAAHASPPRSLSRGIRLLDEHGNILPDEKERWSRELQKYPFDVLIVGHTHQVFAERLGDKLVINPGSSKFNHTCAVLSLPELEIRFLPLSGQEPIKSWNWGMTARMNESMRDG